MSLSEARLLLVSVRGDDGVESKEVGISLDNNDDDDPKLNQVWITLDCSNEN